MSSANVDLARRAFQAAARRPPDWETVNATYDPEHELVSRFDQLEGGSSKGASGFRDWMARMREAG
jgi:hypothetical protein